MTTSTLGRREKLGSSMRSVLNEQLGRVQIKHVAEIEVLDEMRNFLKQRAQIEREYSQSIQKLCQQYLSKRDVKPPPDLQNYNKRDNRGVLEMWKTTLLKTEELGKGRGLVADMLQDSISESLKDLKRRKEQQFKRYFEVAQRMICEVLDTVKDLTTTKKMYRERWKMSEEARTKFTDADMRLKNSQLKLFESKTALERTQKKCAERLQQAQRHSTVTRNEYILSLETTNSHLLNHFETDIPLVMKEIDSDMYDKIQDMYLLYAQIEVDNSNKIKAEFEDLREQSSLVNRDYVMACFLHEHSIFNDKIVYQFEPALNDRVTAISKEHGSEIYLDREAKKQAQSLTKLNQSIADKNKAVKGLQSVTQAYKVTPEFGTSDATAEALHSLFEIQEELRQISVQTHGINTKLDILRKTGVDVDKWLQQAAHIGIEQSNGSHDKPQQQQSDLLDLTKSQQFSVSNLSLAEGDSASLRSETMTDAMSVGSNFSEPYAPKACLVLYHYQAQRQDELDILSDEELEILEWDDGDGWSKGRNKQGQEGYFPRGYIKPISRPNSPTLSEASIMRRTSSLASDVISMTSAAEVAKKYNGTSSTEPIKKNVTLRALFEYNAQDEEELSFPEGALIKLTRTDDNGVDDGWWEGSYEGRVGVFPSVVVEMVSSNSPQDITPSTSEILPTEAATPTSVPPPPSYPAPEISVWDLTIGPHVLNKSNPSSNRPSPTPTRTVINPASYDTPILGDRLHPVGVSKDPADVTMEDSFDMQNSFEDTLQHQDSYSSFEDVPRDDDDVSYV